MTPASKIWLALSLTFAATAVAAAQQCPDGTAPPCRLAVSPVRRTLPALDDRTWIVVPFNNVSRTSDIDWLRDGSVNLLYLDMSRWTDVRVVDDKRVADFLREIPAGRTAQSLSLNDGLALAKRAGAGRLVMGNLIKSGNQTQISATVFDTRRGIQLRVVNERAPAMDSIIGTFSRLAPKILNVPMRDAASLASPASAGTTRIDAYQEYVAGVKALNGFDVATAKQHLEKALQLDSTFALAHYKLAVASVYDEATRMERARSTSFSGYMSGGFEDKTRVDHATAAARLSAGLPDRERSLIAAFLADVRGDPRRACDLYAPLVRADSLDAEALFGLGECLYKDGSLDFVNGDTARATFHTSWNSALAALRKALVTDPTYHLAFRDILTLVTFPIRRGCIPVPPATGCATDLMSLASRPQRPQTGASRPRVFLADVGRAGDSLVMTMRDPMTFRVDNASLVALSNLRPAGRRTSMEVARAVAQEWVDAGPTEIEARKALAVILLQLGEVAQARTQLTAVTDTALDFGLEMTRLEIALKEFRAADAAKIGDRVRAKFGTGLTQAIASVMPAVSGQPAPFDSLFTRLYGAAAARMPPEFRAQLTTMTAYSRQAMRVIMGGGPGQSVAEDQMLAVGNLPDPGKPVDSMVTKFGPTVCTSECWPIMLPSLAFGLRIPRTVWPIFTDSASAVDARVRPAMALAHKDTAALRLAARQLDSLSKSANDSLLPDNGSAAVAADAYLLLGDSARALDMTRRTLDGLMPHTSILEILFLNGGIPIAALWPRTMLLRADLAAAMHQPEEAKVWYKHFLDLWSNADPEFQPIVDRARKAYAALGGR